MEQGMVYICVSVGIYVYATETFNSQSPAAPDNDYLTIRRKKPSAIHV